MLNIKDNINITITGMGYVGLSLAVVLSKKYNIKISDISKEKIAQFNRRDFSFAGPEIREYLSLGNYPIEAVEQSVEIWADADVIFVAVPTDFVEENNSFDTSKVEDVISNVLAVNSKGIIVVRSTVPIGFTDKMREKYQTDRIMFSPEFLREGHAVFDAMHPSRIILGDKGENGLFVKELIMECLENKNVPFLMTNSKEAEMIKLMSNTYLAMRIAFFNEIDTFAEKSNMNTKDIIDGIGLDERIGNHYNNPSFGYGGYCFPKDVKQASVHLQENGALIQSITCSNKKRKQHVLDMICLNKPRSVGIYRLEFKKGSEDSRSSATIEIMNELMNRGINIMIYDEKKNHDYPDIVVTDDLKEFISKADIIVANRMDDELEEVKEKVYTRDVYGID